MRSPRTGITPKALRAHPKRTPSVSPSQKVRRHSNNGTAITKLTPASTSALAEETAKTRGANICVVQTHEYVLSTIRAMREPRDPNNVFYFSDPGKAIIEALKRPVDVLVTGALFYRSKLSCWADTMAVMMCAEVVGSHIIDQYYDPPESGPDTGVELAEEFRKINPNMLVLRFTFLPELDPGNIAGDIPKKRPRRLVHFIGSSQLKQIVQAKDLYGLRREFPYIKFHRGVLSWLRRRRHQQP